jgi:hypothetical protein
MSCGVSYNQSQATVLQFEEVVEVAANLPSRPVVGRYPPAVEFRRRLG